MDFILHKLYLETLICLKGEVRTLIFFDEVIILLNNSMGIFNLATVKNLHIFGTVDRVFR